LLLAEGSEVLQLTLLLPLEELEDPLVGLVPPVAFAPPIAVVPPVAFAPPIAVVPPVAFASPVAISPPVAFTPLVAWTPPVASAPPVWITPPDAMVIVSSFASTLPIITLPPVVVLSPVEVAPPMAALPPVLDPPVASSTKSLDVGSSQPMAKAVAKNRENNLVFIMGYSDGVEREM
jgi:hypothetical protein